jgi:hypothetical protein
VQRRAVGPRHAGSQGRRPDGDAVLPALLPTPRFPIGYHRWADLINTTNVPLSTGTGFPAGLVSALGSGLHTGAEV